MASATGLPPPASASASSSPSVPPAGTLAAPLPSATDSSTGIGGSSSSSSGAAFTSSFSPTSIASATDRWGPISQAASTSALSPHQQHLILQPLQQQQQQQQQWDHSDQHHSGHLTPAASNIRLPTSSPGSHPTLSSAALGGNRLSQTEDAAPSFIRTAQGSSVTYLPSSSGLPPQAGGVGVIGSSAAQLSSPHSRSSGPRHQLSSPTLGVGSPHNSLSAILAGGGPHDDDEHDWEKDIHRQHALGIGHEEDDTDHPRRLPARSSSQRRSHNAASTHTHTHSAASFADWSPPASSPVLHGSRSIHFPPTAGHSRSGSATASAQPQIVSSAHPLHHLHHHHQQQAPPSSLHRLIAPFRDQQQASLSQLLLGTNSAGARSPGSVSSTSTTEYFMSAANQNPVNSDISLFDKSDSDQSRMVRRHQSLNHHIGRGLANRTNPSQLGSPSAVGSSSTVGRNAAAATLRANADPRLGPSNPYTASNRSPPPSQTGPGNESLRSPTSPSRFAGSIFRDRTTVEREREAGNSGSPTPSHFSGAGDGASSPTPGRTRGLSDAPNSLMTLHAHLQQLDIHGASPSLNSRPVPAPLNPSARPPLETEQSVDSLSTVTARTPTGLMHAPHLAQGSSAATGHDATSTSTARDSRQSASEGTDSVNAALAQGPQSEAAAEGSGTNKPRKLPSLITNRDALVRGAMGGGPGAASAAPAGFGFTGSSHFEQAGPSGPATAGAVLHPSDPVEPGHTADSALAGIDSPTAFSPIRGDERDDLEELYEGTRSSSLRQNTFDGAIRPSPSSSSIGQKTGSRFNLLRGTKTAAPVAGWRQKDLIAGGRNEPQAGTDEYAGDDYREGPSAHAGTHTTSLGRASSLHHTHGSGSRYKEYASIAPGMPSVPGDGFGNADVQSQWGIALSPQAGANQAPDLFESLLGGGRPARSGSMRVRGSRNQYDEFPRGGIQEASSEVMSSPYASAGAALDASPYQTSSGLGGAASPTSTALEQANIDTMRLSMALAEQQQKTAFLRAQMSMANNGAGMGGGAVPSVPGLGLPYNPSAGMGLGMGMGLGPAQGPGFIPDALNFGGIGGAQVRPPSLSDGFPQDLGARAAQQFGFGGDANSGLGRGQTQNDISGPPLYDPNLMNGPNGSLSTGIGGLPPLTIPSDTTGGPATGTVPSAVTPSSAVQMAQLIAAKGYNPPTFPMRPVNARYFVIKSFTEDDVYKCLKYEIWASTDKGNQRLDRAFRENSRAPGEGGTDGKGTGPGPIYLFFSVNASGHFCGMAQMLTPVDYNTSSNVWAQDGKWKGTFKVRWIFVKDLPNGQLRHIRLTNTPEVKSVTQSRDTQELPREAGEEVLRIMAEYQARTSLLQDMSFYEMQDQRILPLPAHAGAGGAGGSGMAPSAGPIGSQTPQAPDNPRRRHFVSPPYNNANIGAGPGGHGFHNNQRSFQQDQPASAS